MRLSELVVRNFRGFPSDRDTVFDLDHSVVLLYGKNGMGKTSTLDAIELAATGNIRRFRKYEEPAISRSLINADSAHLPAIVRLTASNGQLRLGEAQITTGTNDAPKPLLSVGERVAFDATSYLTQTEIRRIVTLDSASLGQLVRSLIADERIDTVIDGLAGANINRQNRTYQTLKKRFLEFEESVTRLSTELETKERLFKSVQPSANALPQWTEEISALASTMHLTIESPKGAESAEQALRTINLRIEAELREALSTKSAADENIRLCEQLESEQKTVDNLTQQLTSLDSTIYANEEELSRLKNDLKLQTETLDGSRQRLTEQETFRTLLDTLISSRKLMEGDICPVCDRPFTKLKAHVEAKRGSILAGRNELLKTYEEQEAALQKLRAVTSTAEDQLLETLEQHKAVSRRLLSIQKTRTALLEQIGTQEADLSATLKRERERRDNAAAIIERLTGLSGRATELLGALSSAVIQQSESVRTIEALRTKKSSQEKQLEIARAKKEQLESFIDNIQKLRKRLEEQAEELLRAFTLVDAQRVFSDLFNRLARNPLFQVGFTDARVSNHKPRVDWKALRGDRAYDGELIFSQGELNASALAMFLALASTYQNHLKLLILDDPIQSMDEVHIEELGEVLKAFKDELNWQIVISLHDEAAFKYFRRQLSPSVSGQSLISFVLERAENSIRVLPDRAKGFDEKLFEVAAS